MHRHPVPRRGTAGPGAEPEQRAGLAVRTLAALAVACAVAGCNQTDPYLRPGVWHPLGANASNLRAMVADPHDLAEGRGAFTSPGDIAAASVARLRAGVVKRLPASAIADVNVTDAGASGAPAAGPTPAAPVAAPAAAAATAP